MDIRNKTIPCVESEQLPFYEATPWQKVTRITNFTFIFQTLCIMSWSDWASSVGYVFGKTALSILIPGSSIVIGVSETAKSIWDGDKRGAAINGLFTVVDAVSFGMGSYGKEAMKKGGKEAVILLVKERTKGLPKEATKKVGKHLSKNLAMGISEETLKEAWQKSMKSRCLDIIFKLMNNGKVVDIVVEEFTEEMMKKILQEKASKIMFDPLFKKAFKTAAEEEYKKYCLRNCGLKLTSSVLNWALTKHGTSQSSEEN